MDLRGRAPPLCLRRIAAGSARQLSRAASSDTAIFAGGCFWCMEAAFDEVDGVTETISGYAGGTKPNPTYGDHEGYQEAVKVTYDPAKVTYAKLLDHYWHNIDPFDADGQFCDKGSAYQQRRSSSAMTRRRRWRRRPSRRSPPASSRTVATEIKPVTTFTAAEDYHQDYHNTESGELTSTTNGAAAGRSGSPRSGASRMS